jgi:hypothetical protein
VGSSHSNVGLQAFEYYLVYNDSRSLHDVISCHVCSLNECASLASAVSGRHSSAVSTPFAVQARNARVVTPAYTYAYKRLRLQVQHNHMLAGYRGGWGSRTLTAYTHGAGNNLFPPYRKSLCASIGPSIDNVRRRVVTSSSGRGRDSRIVWRIAVSDTQLRGFF